MRLSEDLPYGRLAVLFVFCALVVLVWEFASKPVLLHTHILAGADDKLCGSYNEPGTAIMNPFRSRLPERIADVFLRAALNARCLPGLSEGLCQFVTQHPLPASQWRLVNRWDSAKEIKLFYRLNSQELARRNGCMMAHVDLEQTGATWTVCGYGFTSGPYRGRE
jgi:hypothetical protein